MKNRLLKIDRGLLIAARTRGHTPALDAIAKTLGKAGNHGMIWFAIGLIGAVIDSGNRHAWIHAAVLGPVAIVVNYAIKIAVRRPRPTIPGLPPLGGAPSSLSFPSAHATASFACATAMTRITPGAAALYILALAISLGRPYLGMHYPSDVLAGVVFGVVLGLAAPLHPL